MPETGLTPDFVVVDDDERVLCLRQYRHTNQQDFVELPAGLRCAVTGEVSRG